MSTQNNVHVSEELLDAMSHVAQSRGEDVNGLFEEAAQRSDAVRLVGESRDQQRGQ